MSNLPDNVAEELRLLGERAKADVEAPEREEMIGDDIERHIRIQDPALAKLADIGRSLKEENEYYDQMAYTGSPNIGEAEDH